MTVPLLLFIALLSWGFASPVGSSPDDNFHLASIWCGLGERPGLCEASGDPDTRLVPSAIVSATCYAFAPEQSAACWDPTKSGLAEAGWLNTQRLYPPLYYAVMGTLASPDIQTSALLMRALNAALSVGLLTAAFWALPRRLRPALVVSALATSVPLGLFILASNNPSAWAFLAAAVLWVCLYGATLTQGRRQIVLCVLTLLAAVLGAGARADAAAFAVFGVVIAAVLGARRSRKLLVPLITAGAVIVTAAAFYLSSGQSQAVVSGLPSARDLLTFGQLAKNALEVPALWIGALGGWGLGWLDTTIPTIVTFGSLAVACGAVFIGMKSFTWRRAVAFGLAALALWAVPFVLLAQSRALVGEIVQPRYILPLLIILIGVVSASPASRLWWRGPRAYVAAAVLAFGAAVAMHVNIQRYTTGVDVAAVDPGARAEWWWVLPASPLAVWIIGSVAFGLALALIAWLPTLPPAAASPRDAGTSARVAASSGEGGSSEALPLSARDEVARDGAGGA